VAVAALRGQGGQPLAGPPCGVAAGLAGGLRLEICHGGNRAYPPDERDTHAHRDGGHSAGVGGDAA